MKETIGEYIHGLRTKAGMTLTKLAAALDIDQSTLSKIENGKRSIPKSILPKLAATFNLDLKNLECEFFSELVAEIIYSNDEPKQVLKLAEEKAKYMRIRKEEQAQLAFDKKEENI
jgi:HTH-type transcriptional regulator, competence development regulator